MRCNFSALFLRDLRSQQKRKETCASTTYTSAFRIFFLTIYISWVLTSIFPVFPYQVFVNETKNILRQDQIMDYALCCQNFCFRSIFSPSNAFWMWNNFFYTLNSTFNSLLLPSTLFKCLGKLLFSSVIRPERVHFLLSFFSAAVFTLKMHTESICFHFNGSNTNPLPFSTTTANSRDITWRK